MSLKSESVCRSTRRQPVLTIAIWMLVVTILCAIQGWASAGALAQKATPVSPIMPARSLWPSFERPKSKGAPDLVIGMIDRRAGTADSLARSAPAMSPVPSVNRLEEHETIQPPPREAGTNIYSLLNGGSATGWLRYGWQMQRLHANLKIADSQAPSVETEMGRHPLLLVEVGRWQLPVVLSSAAQDQ